MGGIAPGSYFIVSQRIFEEDGEHVGICDELGLATCGKDFEDAKSRLASAILTVLNKATELGEIESLLAEKGISVHIPASTQTPIMSYNHFSLRPHECLSPTQITMGDRGLVAV